MHVSQSHIGPATFVTADRGSVSVLFAVIAVCFFGFMALAVDHGSWTHRKSDMQQVADAAALAGVKVLAELKGRETAQKTAEEFLRARAIPDTAFTVVANSGSGRVSVTLTEAGKDYLAPMLGRNSPMLQIVAEAATNASARPCIIALDPAAPIGIDFSLSGSVTAIDCAIWSNSTSASSFDVNGSGTGSSTQNCAVGGITGSGFAITPPPQAGCAPAADPMLAWTSPTSPFCDYTDLDKLSVGAVTLTPGVYCGGLKIGGTTQVVLEPGTYIFKNGPLKVNAGASLIGQGVSIILTGTNSGADFTGSAKVRLSAPLSGANEGLVIAAGRDQAAFNSKVSGGVEMDIEGSIYLPTHNLSYGGNSESSMPSSYTFLVAKTIKFHGGSTVVVRGNPDTAAVPAKNKAMVLTDVRLVR